MQSTQQERLYRIVIGAAIVLAVLVIGGAWLFTQIQGSGGPAPVATLAAPSTSLPAGGVTSVPVTHVATAASPAPTIPAAGSPTAAVSPAAQLTAAGVGAPSATPPDATTVPDTPTEIAFNRPTDAVTSTLAPNATATFADNPLLVLTPATQAAPTATPPPLNNLGSAVELSVAQVQRIPTGDGYILVADIGNTVSQSVKDIGLLFTDASGKQVGARLPLNLNLPPNDARPGLTVKLALTDPIIVNWATLTARATGTPATAAAGQPGAVAAVQVSPPQIVLGPDSYSYQATVTNTSGAAVTVLNQNIAFFSNNGVLLLVLNLGPRGTLAAGATYVLTGTIPLNQPVTEGHALGEYTDVLANIIAEVAP